MNFDFELSRANCTFYLYDCTGRAFALPLASVKVGKKAGNTHISQDGGKYW